MDDAHNGKQHNLGKDKAEARKAFHALLAREDAPVIPERISIRKLSDQYLAYLDRTASRAAFNTSLLYLKQFCDHIGSRAVCDIRVEHVTAWEVANTQWSKSTVATVRGILIACLNWGVGQGIIPQTPIPRLKAGKTTRRERVVSDDELTRIREAVPQAMRDFLMALELTGARPFSEVALLTAADVDFADGTIKLTRHKNARKGKARTIYITPPLEELLRQKCEERPTGLLFRSPRNAPFTRHLMCWWLRRMEKKLSIPRLTTYAIRHAAITAALEKGVTSDIAGELYGNSPQTITRYYSHLSAKKESLKAAARKAIG